MRVPVRSNVCVLYLLPRENCHHVHIIICVIKTVVERGMHTMRHRTIRYEAERGTEKKKLSEHAG